MAETPLPGFRVETYITGEDTVRIHVFYQKTVRVELAFPKDATEAERKQIKTDKITEICQDIGKQVKKEVKDFDTGTGEGKNKVTDV